jgi:Magnesium chelatase, subunit ChlI
MLARRLTTILPAMTLMEAPETTRLHSVAGRTGARTALVTARPCRAPHQTISDVGLIGGGHLPMPGEVSRAHHGRRFLDELPECRRHVLEVLRQPLKGKSQAYNLTCVMDLTALAAWVTQIIGPTFQPSGRVQTVLSRAAFAGLASRHVMPHLPLDKSDHRGQRCSDPATVDSSLP